MNEALILEHKTFISAKRAAEISGYTSDYVGQLCRAGKLECKIVGRSWFATEESLLKHQRSISENGAGDVIRDDAQGPRKVESLVLGVPVVPVASPVPKLIKESDANCRVTFVPPRFALPYSISQSYIFSPSIGKPEASFPFFKISLGAGIFALSFFFLAQSMFFSSNSDISKNVPITAAVSGIDASLVMLGNIFSAAHEFFIAFFVENKDAVSAADSPPRLGRIAVAPSSGSEDQDEIMKQRIRDSFSDEVQVKPDESGTAGVITPVFKKAKADDFVYVLVPVQ